MNKIATDIGLSPAATEIATRPKTAKDIYNEAVNLDGLDKNGDRVHSSKRNAAGAIELYRQADAMGYLPATYNLAMSLFQGDGIEQNRAEAVKLLRKAADGNIPRACVNLGYCYQLGIGGLQPDSTQALNWYDRAARLGDETGRRNAVDLRSAIRNRSDHKLSAH